MYRALVALLAGDVRERLDHICVHACADAGADVEAHGVRDVAEEAGYTRQVDVDACKGAEAESGGEGGAGGVGVHIEEFELSAVAEEDRVSWE